MIFNFTGDYNLFEKGLAYAKSYIGFEICQSGTTVNLKKGECLRIAATQNGYEITYSVGAEVFRGCAILAEKIRSGAEAVELTEKRHFETCGVMLDCSRNAVPKVETVRDIMCRAACMGLNMAMLYTEDTYRIDGYPYFGYMRGAYTKEELKKMDEYAMDFGIELIPCIQTLGHLGATLRWGYGHEIRDNEEVLLIDEPKTYEFIEAMIKSVSECFTSKRIHIGMDEAHGVGLGTYLYKHGYKNRFDILAGHLEKVMNILNKYGREPMMWSDMFFRLGSKDGDYYDLNAEFPEDIGKKIPESMSMVFWDYYHDDENLYDKMIQLHKKLGREVVFAGGIWIWRGMGAAYHKTLSSSEAALKMCRKNGVKHVFATVWGDDGAEVPLREAFLGMQLWAEYQYYDTVSNDHLERMFKICTGYDMEAFLCFDCDNFDRKRCNTDVVTVSKNLLYQDILCGLFDKNFSCIDIRNHYAKVYEKVKNINEQKGMEHIYEWYRKLLEVLICKSDIGIRIQKAYRQGDKNELCALAHTLKELKDDVRKLKQLYITMWDRENKAFGFDMIDMRFGGLVSRIETAILRIKNYTDGKTEVIEELEEEKLMYNSESMTEEVCLLECPAYHSIQSASSKLIY